MTWGAQTWLYLHVEERSMEACLDTLRPRFDLPASVRWKVINHASKQSLLRDLESRLRGYAKQAHHDIRVMVLVDRDEQDCLALKAHLERKAVSAGFATKSQPDAGGRFAVVNRIVVEELEAWLLGDATALCKAFPKLSPTYVSKKAYRDPDAVRGGTAEALLRLLQQAGYYAGADRLAKIEVAERVAAHMSLDGNRSHSFNQLVSGLRSLLDQSA